MYSLHTSAMACSSEGYSICLMMYGFTGSRRMSESWELQSLFMTPIASWAQTQNIFAEQRTEGVGPRLTLLDEDVWIKHLVMRSCISMNYAIPDAIVSLGWHLIFTDSSWCPGPLPQVVLQLTHLAKNPLEANRRVFGHEWQLTAEWQKEITSNSRNCSNYVNLTT